MCEIAVIPSEDGDADRAVSATNLAETLYESNPDGLGLIAVHREDDRFEYDVAKCGWNGVVHFWPKQGRDTTSIFEWILGEMGDAWRIVMHARLGTAGENSKANTHPLHVSECDEEAWDMVVHNGIVSRHEKELDELAADGHTICTEVDSEAIAHDVSMPSPEQFEDHDSDWEGCGLFGRLNFLLFNEDQILIRNDRKYTVTDDFKMACTRARRGIANEFREQDDSEDSDSKAANEKGWSLFTPDGDSFHRSVTKSTQSTIARQARTYRGRGSTAVVRSSSSDSSDNDDDESQASGWGYYDDWPAPDVSDGETGDGEDDGIHWGWVMLEVDNVCREHGTTFNYTCPQCLDEGLTVQHVDTQNEPDYETEDGEFYVTTRDGDDIQVEQCEHNSEVFYHGKYCPHCNPSRVAYAQ